MIASEIPDVTGTRANGILFLMESQITCSLTAPFKTDVMDLRLKNILRRYSSLEIVSLDLLLM